MTRFPFDPPTLVEPPAEFALLRAREPVALVELPSGDRAWLVSRYADVRQVLADPRLSRAAATMPGAPRVGPARPEAASLMAMDPPEHTRLRRLLAGEFSDRAVERLRPGIERLTDELLDGMEKSGPPADLVEHLGEPLPLGVICELLGVPEPDRATFTALTADALSLDRRAEREVKEAREGLRELLAGLVSGGADGLLGRLAALPDDLDPVAVGATLLTAGYQTVRNIIVNGVLTLLIHPGQYASLARRPELLPSAVEELLRYTPAAASGGTIRIALEDLEIGGCPIRAGEAVIPATTSANRDAAVFDRPDDLVLDRGENPHVAFGPGIHHCLGARLARAELTAAFGGLVRRFPELRLAIDPPELTWTSGVMIRGLTALPVVW